MCTCEPWDHQKWGVGAYTVMGTYSIKVLPSVTPSLCLPLTLSLSRTLLLSSLLQSVPTRSPESLGGKQDDPNEPGHHIWAALTPTKGTHQPSVGCCSLIPQVPPAPSPGCKVHLTHPAEGGGGGGGAPGDEEAREAVAESLSSVREVPCTQQRGAGHLETRRLGKL